MVKRYGSLTAVDGLTLTARRGEVTAILGPNGAGKTTTIEVCEGYRNADAGTVRVLGLDPAADATALRPRVGVMLQSGGIPPARAGCEYLTLLSRFHEKPHDPAWLLDIVGLTGSARTPYKRLSGGQQQRLSLAAAIVGRPELVFLDEPTAGMDPQARHATWDLVTALRADGVSVILTTHFMEEAERLSDHVVIIDAGQAVADGSPAELTGSAGAAALPGRARARHRQPAGGAARRQRRQGIPRRALPDRGARGERPARPARRGHRLVRRARRAAEQPAHRVPHAGGRVPRARPEGSCGHDRARPRRRRRPPPGGSRPRRAPRRCGGWSPPRRRSRAGRCCATASSSRSRWSSRCCCSPRSASSRWSASAAATPGSTS